MKFQKYRTVTLIIGICTLLLHEFIAKPYYRTFIYSHNLFDFHIADTLGNSLGTISAAFIVAGIFGTDKVKGLFFIKMTTLSFIIYELLQPLLGKPIDPWDIIATIISGGLSFLLYRLIYKAGTADRIDIPAYQKKD